MPLLGKELEVASEDEAGQMPTTPVQEEDAELREGEVIANNLSPRKNGRVGPHDAHELGGEVGPKI